MVDRKIREIGEIRVEEITDPLELPLKRGGLVCPPLESPMISNCPDGDIRGIREIRVQK